VRNRASITPCKQSIGPGCTNRSVGAGHAWCALRAIVALGAAVFCVGCVTPPDISITAVNVVEVGQEASEVSIMMSLENASEVPIKLDMWDYRFAIGGHSYSGQWSAGLTIPPKQTVTTSIPAVLPTAAAVSATSSWRVGGSVTFLAPSRLAEVLFELGLNRPSASFNGAGTTVGSGGPAPSAG